MISLSRAKCCIIQLKETNDARKINTQRGMKGHIVVFPQDPSAIATKLPPSLEEVAKPICIIFIGSSAPTREWIMDKATPLTVRPFKVCRALEWLKIHNPLYADVDIDYRMLESLPEESKLPVDFHRYENEAAVEGLTSHYDPVSSLPNDHPARDETLFARATVPDLSSTSTPHQMRLAAASHVKDNHGAFIQVPHGNAPCNEFKNPVLFPQLFPTLFPYGIGGFENVKRTCKLSMERHVKH
ncbi:hypothetical protein BKA70DRAFT_1064045, partial [Coprinopsis sp. MPI-PUGE-AT-0042]